MDKLGNEDIRRRVYMHPAKHTTNKNNIRWWSQVKRMPPRAPQSKALAIKPVGRRPRRIPRNRREDDIQNVTMKLDGIPMTEVNNWVKYRRPIIYQLTADGRIVWLR